MLLWSIVAVWSLEAPSVGGLSEPAEVPDWALRLSSMSARDAVEMIRSKSSRELTQAAASLLFEARKKLIAEPPKMDEAKLAGTALLNLVRHAPSETPGFGHSLHGHGNLINGLADHLAIAGVAEDELSTASDMFDGDGDRHLAAIARLARSAVQWSRLLEGDYSRLSRSLEDIEKLNEAYARELKPAAAAYIASVEAARFIISGSGGQTATETPPYSDSSSERRAIFRYIALQSRNDVRAAAALARAADSMNREAAEIPTLLELAIIQDRDGHYEEAISILMEYLGSHPADRTALACLADAYMKTDQWTAARSALASALPNEPTEEDVPILLMLYAGSLEFGDPDAEQWSRLLEAVAPEYLLQNQISGGSILQHATSLRNPSIAAKIAEGERHFHSRDFTSAEAAYRAALAEDPDNAMAWLFLGDVFFQNNSHSLAQAYFEESIACEPTPIAFRFLGDSLTHVGKRERAASCYREALRLDPNYGGAASAIEARGLPQADGRDLPPLRWDVQPELQPTTGFNDFIRNSSSTKDAANRGDAANRPAILDELFTDINPEGLRGDDIDIELLARRLVAKRAELEKQGRSGELMFALALSANYEPFSRIYDDEAFGSWLANAEPEQLHRCALALRAVTFYYAHKDRKLAEWKLMAERGIQLAEALPEEFGPNQSQVGLGRDRIIADAYMEYGHVLRALGRPAEALDCFSLALERHYLEERARENQGLSGRPEYDRAVRAGDPITSVFRALHNACIDLNDNVGASEYERQAIERAESRALVEPAGRRYSGAGERVFDEGDQDLGLAIVHEEFEYASRESDEDTTPAHVAVVLNSIASIHQKLGLGRSALRYATRSHELNSATRNQDRLASNYVTLARIYQNRPDLGDALRSFEDALKTCSSTDSGLKQLSWTSTSGTHYYIVNVHSSWDKLLELAQFHEEKGDSVEACRYLELAARVVELARSTVDTDELRVGVSTARSAATSKLAKIAVSQAADHGSSANVSYAWDAAERMRGRSFLDELATHDLSKAMEVPAHLADREAEALSDRERLLSSGRRDRAYWTELEGVNARLDTVWSTMLSTDPTLYEYVEMRRGRPVSLARVTECLAEDGRPTAMISLVLADNELFAIVTRSHSGASSEVIKVSTDTRKLIRFIGANFGPAGHVRELATDLHDLYQHVMRPTKEKLY